ncbi:MAG: AmmeMemoRadiSam system protein A [Terriglobales bacterium]|jgi:AmmeMemoRadiSam system protein A
MTSVEQTATAYGKQEAQSDKRLKSAIPEYSDDERSLLLDLAHRAIDAELSGKKIDTKAPTEHLAQLRAAFTTLHLGGQLRGCVGYLAASLSVYRTVAETALAAAFHDARFHAVTGREIPHLKIEISVLSSLYPIIPEDIEVGKHGLVVSLGERRGLLLPQVPIELQWDRQRFLEQTCCKAGLPPDAWKRNITLEAFTAEVFGEA